jgi:Phosphotransferase enzyme family
MCVPMMRFDSITKLNIRSRSALSAGFVNGRKFFIKEYSIRKGKEKGDLLKVKCEQLCYRNLGASLNLPALAEADYKNRRLILDFAKFRNASASKKTIDDTLNFQSRVMKRVDASFLPTVTYAYYGTTLRKLAAELKDKEIAKLSKNIFVQFEKNRQSIAKSAKYFSHGDMRLENIKYLNQRLTIIDLEHSRKDNLMCDLACLYVDLYGSAPLTGYLMSRITKMKEFDKRLFNLMVSRRCIEVLHALKNHKGSRSYKKAKELLLK